jgi:hypothetical protein
MGRYQFQPWRVRACRCAIWYPLMLLWFAWDVCRWTCAGFPAVVYYHDGCEPFNQTFGERLFQIWRMRKSLVTMQKMKHYYTLDEVIEKMRAEP